MANLVSSTAELAGELATFIRHTGVDDRIYDWLVMSFNETRRRCHVWWWRVFGALQIDANETAASLPSTLENLAEPSMCIIYVGATQKFHLLHYKPLNEIRSYLRGHPQTSDIPLVYSIGPDPATYSEGAPTTSESGKSTIWVYPKPSQIINVYLYGYGPALSTRPDYFQLQIHWEHVLLWRAASYAMMHLNPMLYPIYHAEAEQALSNFRMMMESRPDSRPQFNKVANPWKGTSRMLLNRPDTIPNPY